MYTIYIVFNFRQKKNKKKITNYSSDYTVKNNFDGKRKFILDFKTNIQAFLCFEIKGKFPSNEKYFSFKKVQIFQNSLP